MKRKKAIIEILEWILDILPLIGKIIDTTHQRKAKKEKETLEREIIILNNKKENK